MEKRKFDPETFWALVGIHAAALVAGAYMILYGYMWTSWICFVFMFIIGKVGISMGYHRRFTHQAFDCKPWVDKTLAVLAACAVQSNGRKWPFWHNLHHAFADGPGDPHRPTEYPGWRGFFWSHMQWTWYQVEVPAGYRAESFLGHYKNRALMWQADNYWKIVVLAFAVPGLICAARGIYVYGGSFGFLRGLFEGVFLAGFFRVFWTFHATWSVNSIGHIIGDKVEEALKRVDSPARNNWFVSAVSWFVGEGWHSNHHNYPRCAMLGWKWWQIDFCKPLIKLGERTGQIWAVNYGPFHD